MRIDVIAVGRLKQGPERELAERYHARFEDTGRRLGFKGLTVREIAESRARDAPSRLAEESAAIQSTIPTGCLVMALDERGDSIASEKFAQSIGQYRDSGQADLAFLIGGADGLSPDLRRIAKSTIAFGGATWPHQLVRVMLLEQLYRAVTLLAGHPYHRA